MWQYFPKRDSAPVACSAGVALDWCLTLYPGLRGGGFENTGGHIDPPVIIKEDASESSSESSDSNSSEASGEPVEPEAALNDCSWLLAKGKKGCLHLAHGNIMCLTKCGRPLSRPEEGSGLEAALQSSHEWSPRCWRNLSDEQRK